MTPPWLNILHGRLKSKFGHCGVEAHEGIKKSAPPRAATLTSTQNCSGLQVLRLGTSSNSPPEGFQPSVQQDQQQIQPKYGSVWPEDEVLLCQSFKKESLDQLILDIPECFEN